MNSSAEGQAKELKAMECGFRMSLPDNTGGAIYCNKQAGHSGDHGHNFQIPAEAHSSSAGPSVSDFWEMWHKATYGDSVEQYMEPWGWRIVAWRFAEAYAAQFFPASQQVPQPSVNYLREVTPRPDDPSCHVCGALMSADHWKCGSCGAHTGVEGPAASRGAATAQPKVCPTCKRESSIVVACSDSWHLVNSEWVTSERGATPGEPAQVKEKP